jgi:tRNA pseudouridine55 synthase
LIDLLSYIVDESCNAESFAEGRVLFIDKPYKWTSFDIVNKIRSLLKYHLGLRKLKTGHTGTLDPLATGLMIVCIGKMTKNIEQLTGLDKEYIAEITFGGTTPSFDLETEIEQTYNYSHINSESIKNVLKQFSGKQMQTPPLYSAIRINRKRAYQYARNGVNMELKQREVTFYKSELLEYIAPVAKIKINCSKGTYIRSFADDLGKNLQSGAYLSALKRTFIGNFSLKEAITIEQFESILEKIKIIV